MKSFKKYLQENNLWDDKLDAMFGNLRNSTIVSKDAPKTTNFTLTLYRGFDGNWDEIRQEGNFYILSPKKSEQGLIWFTHPYINAYNPVQYAAGHGEWFLTYPLQCRKHIQTVHWSDGSTHNDIPQEIQALTKPTENCKYYMGIELPDGWVFSYKMEKFVGSTIEIKITKDMIKASKEVLNEE